MAIRLVSLSLMWAAGGAMASPQTGRSSDSGVGVDVAPTAESNRVLPLRGEALLKRLLQPMPAIYALKIAPNGSKVAYFDTLLERFRVGMYPNTVPIKSLIVVDLANGKSLRLSFGALQGKLQSFPASSPILQWSHDSRRVSTLAMIEGIPRLLVWNVRANEPPTTLSLSGTDTAETIDSWAWLSERNQLLIGLTKPSATPEASQPGADRKAKPLEPNEVWFMSRAPEWHRTTEEMHTWLLVQPRQQMRLAVVGLSDGHWSSVKALGGDTPFDDRALVEFDSGDAAGKSATTHVLQQRSWVLGQVMPLVGMTGGPSGGAFETLWSLDLDTGTVKPRYSSSTGRLFTVATTKDRDKLITTEGEAYPTQGDPFSWPAPGYPALTLFGHVRELAEAATASRVVDAEPSQTYSSVLFASDQSGTMYEAMPTAPEPQLFELDLTTGKRVSIGPLGFSVTFADVSADGRTIVAVLENLNTPSELYSWKRNTRKWTKLTHYTETIGTLPVAHFEKLSWPSRDGKFLLDGFLLKPPDFDARKRYPLIVLAHGGHWPPYINVFGLGGTAGGSGSAILPHALADAGYLVLQPNDRGADGSDGYSFQFAQNWPAETPYEDIDAGVDEVIRRGWADAKQVGFIGHSMGSLPLNYALIHPERYRAAVNSDGDVLLPQFSRLTNSSPGFTDPLFGRDTVENPPVNAYQIRVPLLIRRSDLQEYLKPGETPLGPDAGYDAAAMATKLLRYVMAKNDVPFEVMMDQDEHVIANPTNLLEYQSRVLQWFDYFVQGKGENPIPAMDSPLGFKQWSSRTP